jgi:hypothetical protein
LPVTMKLQWEWSNHIQTADRAADRVDIDANSEFAALQRVTDDPVERRKLYSRAAAAHGDLPEQPEIIAAFRAVDGAVRTKPSPDDYHLMAGILLNGLFIPASETGDGFMEMLAFELAEVFPDVNDGRGAPRWIPIPAVAAAIQHTVRTFRGNYGKPPYIPEIIEFCRDQRLSLVTLRNNIVFVGRTQQRLCKLLEAIEDRYPEDD